uniref:Uncharacterized protein n=1 Tax=Oryza punctata TaxID=4537 RepID=A0A0E0KGT3_ORYPU
MLDMIGSVVLRATTPSTSSGGLATGLSPECPNASLFGDSSTAYRMAGIFYLLHIHGLHLRTSSTVFLLYVDTVLSPVSKFETSSFSSK